MQKPYTHRTLLLAVPQQLSFFRFLISLRFSSYFSVFSAAGFGFLPYRRRWAPPAAPRRARRRPHGPQAVSRGARLHLEGPQAGGGAARGLPPRPADPAEGASRGGRSRLRRRAGRGPPRGASCERELRGGQGGGAEACPQTLRRRRRRRRRPTPPRPVPIPARGPFEATRRLRSTELFDTRVTIGINE